MATPGTGEAAGATVATAAPSVVKPAPVLATQPEPTRRLRIGKELIKVLIVTTITSAILIVLWFVLR